MDGKLCVGQTDKSAAGLRIGPSTRLLRLVASAQRPSRENHPRVQTEANNAKPSVARKL